MASWLAQLDAWLLPVRRMRLGQPWGDIMRMLNHAQRASSAKLGVCAWAVKKLPRTVKRLARARRQGGGDRLVRLVAGIKAAAPDRTLQQIATQL